MEMNKLIRTTVGVDTSLTLSTSLSRPSPIHRSSLDVIMSALKS